MRRPQPTRHCLRALDRRRQPNSSATYVRVGGIGTAAAGAAPLSAVRCPLSVVCPPEPRAPSAGLDEEEAAQILHELCRLRTQSRGKVKKLVTYLSTAVLKGDYCFVSTFINIYWRHATTWQVWTLPARQ